VLLVNMHHIVSDGWSASVLKREFSQMYQAYANGDDPVLPELKIQYADYAIGQRQWLQGEVLEQQLNYWKTQLAGVSILDLPADHARSATANPR